MISSCVLCKSKTFIKIFNVKEFPVFPFIKNRKQMTFGEINIVRCKVCGHMFNKSFDQELINKLYTTDFITNSPVSQSMIKSIEFMKDWLLNLFKNKKVENVLEIGGGSGSLALSFLADVKNYVMIEPSNEKNCNYLNKKGVKAINDIFPSKKIPEIKYDLVISRQVLEHIQDPETFLKSIRRFCNNETLVYIEIPSAEYILDNNSISDFHYPHVHYYKNNHIKFLFNKLGFKIIKDKLIKNGHDIGFVLKLNDKLKPVLPKNQKIKVLTLKNNLKKNKNLKVGLYGANAYSQSFLGIYNEDFNIPLVFDDTSEYSGLFVYGNSKKSIPIFLPNKDNINSVEIIIITAYLHDVTIFNKIKDFGFKGEIFTVRTDKTNNFIKSFYKT